MSGLHVLGTRVAVLGVKWSKAASVDDVLASKDSLRRGDKGDAVGHVQRFLGIPEDGKYGSDTEQAVAALQDAHVTDPHERGVVNAATYRAIMAFGPGSRSTPAAASPPQPVAPPVPGATTSPPTEPSREDTATPTWKKVVFAALAAAVVGGGALLLRRKG